MSSQKAQRKPNEVKSPSNVAVTGMDISDRSVYSLSKRTSGNIVDLVLKIMDAEGPRPMKNLRPAQKNRNGADQFYMEHHAEYEARGQQSRDKIGRVHTHNNAYPKMYDELNKRRSTAKTGAPYTANQNPTPSTNFDPNCRICVKLKKQVELDGRRKRYYSKSRSHHQKQYGSKPSRDVRTKITKNKRPQRRYRSPSRMYKLSKIRLNKGCQCTCYYVPAETKSVSTFNEFVSAPQQDVKMAASSFGNNETKHVSPMQAAQKAGKKPSKSDIDSGNPETSAPSVSSYNSYMSMDHEPMVE